MNARRLLVSGLGFGALALVTAGLLGAASTVQLAGDTRQEQVCGGTLTVGPAVAQTCTATETLLGLCATATEVDLNQIGTATELDLLAACAPLEVDLCLAPTAVEADLLSVSSAIEADLISACVATEAEA